MTSARERVQAMMAAGKITAEEGGELLRALDQKRRGWREALLDPLELLSTERCLVLGALAAVLGVVVAIAFDARFDGALDLHFGRTPVSWRQALVDQALAWPLPTVVLFAAARVAGSRARFVDLAACVGLARLSYVAMALVAYLILPPLGPPGGGMEATLATVSDPMLRWRLLAGAVATLPFLIYFIVLLYRGYRTATDLRGARLVVSFASGVVLAEVLSKAALAAW